MQCFCILPESKCYALRYAAPCQQHVFLHVLQQYVVKTLLKLGEIVKQKQRVLAQLAFHVVAQLCKLLDKLAVQHTYSYVVACKQCCQLVLLFCVLCHKRDFFIFPLLFSLFLRARIRTHVSYLTILYCYYINIIILYIILGIEEEEMQVVRGCVKKICYK